jgi:hypothetical protein
MPKIAMRESRGTISLSSPPVSRSTPGDPGGTRQHAVWIALLAPESESGTGIVWQVAAGKRGRRGLSQKMPGPVMSFPGPSRLN